MEQFISVDNARTATFICSAVGFAVVMICVNIPRRLIINFDTINLLQTLSKKSQFY